MSKTASGFMLVGGVALAIAGGLIANSSVSSTPADDFYYDCWRYGGGGMILAGLVAFFFGAMWFARK